MNGEPTVPVPIPDLLAAARAVIDSPSASTVREFWDARENLSAEDVVDLAARVETLEALARADSMPTDTVYQRERRADALAEARRFVGQSTTETT